MNIDFRTASVVSMDAVGHPGIEVVVYGLSDKELRSNMLAVARRIAKRGGFSFYTMRHDSVRKLRRPR